MTRRKDGRSTHNEAQTPSLRPVYSWTLQVWCILLADCVSHHLTTLGHSVGLAAFFTHFLFSLWRCRQPGRALALEEGRTALVKDFMEMRDDVNVNRGSIRIPLQDLCGRLRISQMSASLVHDYLSCSWEWWFLLSNNRMREHGY
jgi:hypothetical protein